MAFSTRENLAETQRLRIETIDADLDIATTFVQMAERAGD